jgi:rhomboid protease GluP
MSQSRETLLTKTALALIEQGGYLIIDVRVLGKELWLNHPQRLHELIRLSIAHGFNLPNQVERTKAIQDAIEKAFDQPMTLFDVKFDEEDTLYVEGDRRIDVTLSPMSTGNRFLEKFPYLQDVLVSAEVTPQEDEQLQKRLDSHRPKRERKTVRKTPVATLTIIIVSLIMHSAVGILSEFGVRPESAAIILGAYYKTFIVANFEYWRFLSAGFIHISLVHLMVNLYALYNLGLFFENQFGWKRMLITLMTGILGGSAFMFVTSGNLLAVGLSGGLFAVLGSIIVFQFEVGLIKQRAVQMQILQLIIINGLISLMPGIAVMAHVGGLVSGILLAIYFSHRPTWKDLRRHVTIASGILVLAVGVLMALDDQREPFYPETDVEILEFLEGAGFGWYTEGLENNLIDYYTRELE